MIGGTKWILVANAAKARILKFHRKSNLEEIKTFEHAQSRLHEGDLVSDGPGKTHESVGNMRHGIEPHHSAKESEAIKFAAEIATYLNLERGKSSYESLHVFSSPEFLGHLRDHFSDLVLKSIQSEINKDFTKLNDKDITKHLS